MAESRIAALEKQLATQNAQLEKLEKMASSSTSSDEVEALRKKVCRGERNVMTGLASHTRWETRWGPAVNEKSKSSPSPLGAIPAEQGILLFPRSFAKLDAGDTG